MRLWLFLALSLSALINPLSVEASDPPVLISPTDQTTVNSSKLTWQTPSYPVYSSNPYRVQVDSDNQFVSPDKDYMTDNTFYTPALNPNLWYWRVKVKDQTGSWSDWSQVWSFNLVTATPTPSPSNSPSPSPTIAPSSTASPNPTSPPSPTTSPNQFLVSNLPVQINSNQSSSIAIQISLANNSNQTFYLKGAFYKSGSTNYFGQTKVNGSWVKNSASYPSQLQIKTDGNGNFQANIEVMPDDQDSGFSGSGDYLFKVARYNSSGDLSWSDSFNINISYQATPAPTSTPLSVTSTPTAPPSKYPDTNTKIPTPNLIIATDSSELDPSLLNIASIAGVASYSGLTDNQLVTSRSGIAFNFQKSQPFNWLILFGGLVLLLSLVSLLPLLSKNHTIRAWFMRLTLKLKQLNWPKSWPKN